MVPLEYRPENHNVLLLLDIRGEGHVAVKVTEDRLWALTRWVSGRLGILKNTKGERDIYIFFKSNGVRSYVRPGEWIVKCPCGNFSAVETKGHLTRDYLEATEYQAQSWYQT